MSNGLETRFPNLYLAILTQISRQTWELWLLPQAKLRGVPPDAIEAAGVHPTSLVTLKCWRKQWFLPLNINEGWNLSTPIVQDGAWQKLNSCHGKKGADSPDSIHKQNSEQMYTLKKYLDSSFQEFHPGISTVWPEISTKNSYQKPFEPTNFFCFLVHFGWTDIPSPHISWCSWRLRKSIPRPRGTCNGKNCQKRRQIIGEKLRMRRPETTLWF